MQICIDLLVLLDELMLMQDASKLTYYYEYTYVHYRTCMVHKEGNA